MINVWLNGRIISQEAATLSITDRGFTLADGVFETIRADDGCALWLIDHLTRLRRGASTLGIAVPFSDEVLTNAVNQLLHAEALGSYSLRITLTRGPTASRGLWNAVESYKPTLLITLSSRADVGHQQLVIAQSTRRNHFSPLSRIKSLNYGDKPGIFPRLGDEILCPAAHSLDGDLDAGPRCHDHNGQSGVGCLELGEQIEALLPRGGVACVVEIDDGEGEVAGLDGLDHRGGRLDRLDMVTLGLQEQAEGFEYIGLIVRN